MSEATEDAAEEQEDGGVPAAAIAMVGAIVFLVAISAMFAIGFIPPLVGGKAQATTRATAQFITITTAGPAVTSTLTGPGGTTTITRTAPNYTIVTATTTATTTATSISATTSTVTQPGQITTVLVPIPTTTTTTTTTTTMLTTTVTTTPATPLDVAIGLEGLSTGQSYSSQTFMFDIAVTNRSPSTNMSITVSQETPGSTPYILSFFPSVPETVQEQAGTYDYKVLVTVSSHAPIGRYALDLAINAFSFKNGAFTTTNIQQQFLLDVAEPLMFTGSSVVKPGSQFSGSCSPTSYGLANPPTWIWQCAINAAPGVNGTLQFTVNNLSNQGICIQATAGSNTMTGFVSMSPYPFCLGGVPGVFVPAGATNWPFTFLMTNGPAAGVQTVFFTFTR